MKGIGGNPARINIMTRWAAEVTPDNVLPEYPRPQAVRERWLNLNGLWDYAIRDIEEDEIPRRYDGTILVPFPVEAPLSGVQKPLLPDQKLWYRRTFTVPEEWAGRKVLLHFGAVDWKAEVWVNGAAAGEHTGGFYPFSMDITSLLREEVNELVVAVWDPTDAYGQERGKQVLKPGGIFYTAVSGIWQTVWLEPVPSSYISAFRLTPDIDREELRLQVTLGGESGGFTVEAAAFEDGHEIAAVRGSAGSELRLKVKSPRLWSPDNPFLYDLQIRLLDGRRQVADRVESYFGMRKFSVAEDGRGIRRLCLNNRPLFQNGLLDQGYWPDGLYTAPTDEALKYDIEMAKKLGFNMIRKHIKVEPARWYYHCDRLGMIVWQDMINGGGKHRLFHHVIRPMIAPGLRVNDRRYRAAGRAEKANRDNFKKELNEMIDSLYNYPCIGMWVIFNEGWGQFDADEISAWVQRCDPSRYIDHASGWHDQGAGDVKSIHTYFFRLKMPPQDHRAVIISEYGGYSYSEKGHLWREGRQFGYKKFASREDLTGACLALIKDQLKPTIARGLSGAVYTQLTDVETETNGLLTYDRKVLKVDLAALRRLNEELSYPGSSSIPGSNRR
jgi:beta-galactosidase/beta-glucuronidase